MSGLWSPGPLSRRRDPAADGSAGRRLPVGDAGYCAPLPRVTGDCGRVVFCQDLGKLAAPRSATTGDVLGMCCGVTPPFLPADAQAMTVVIEWPPGDPGAPPHRHPGGPAFGYVLEGEMLFELEGAPPRAIKAGEAFWEPGGDVIHYSDGNNRSDILLRYLVTMVCDPGQPMLVVVEDDELEARRDRRVSRPS